MGVRLTHDAARSKGVTRLGALLTRRALAWFACAVIAGVCGCNDHRDDSPTGASRTVQRGGATFTAAVDAIEIGAADRVVVTVSAAAPTGALVELPLFDGEVGDFSVVEISPIETRVMGDGRVEKSRRIVLEPFLPGEYEIPSLVFAWLPDEGEPTLVQTPEIVIRVLSSLGDVPAESGLAPWRGVVEVEDPARSTMWAVAAAAAVCALGIVGVIAWRRRPRRTSASGVDPLRALAEAAVAEHEDEERTRSDLDACVSALRAALAAHLGEASHGWTVGELLTEATARGVVRGEDIARINPLLAWADRVRFGGDKADSAQARALASALHDMVRHLNRRNISIRDGEKRVA